MADPSQQPASSDEHKDIDGEEHAGEEHGGYSNLHLNFPPHPIPPHPQDLPQGPSQIQSIPVPSGPSPQPTGNRQPLVDTPRPQSSSRPHGPDLRYQYNFRHSPGGQFNLRYASPRETDRRAAELEQNALTHLHPRGAPPGWECTIGFNCELREFINPGEGVVRLFVPGRRLKYPDSMIPEKYCQDIDYEIATTLEGAEMLAKVKASRAKTSEREDGERLASQQGEEGSDVGSDVQNEA